MPDGWICLHRKVRESAVFQDDGLFKLWCLCLLLANHRPAWLKVDGLAKPIQVGRGQFITGRFALHKAFYTKARKSNKSPSTLWRMLETLRDMQNLSIKTNSRFSLITIVNYEEYQQAVREVEQPVEQPVNSRRTAGEQPVNTNNKNNNSNKGEDKHPAPASGRFCAKLSPPYHTQAVTDSFNAWFTHLARLNRLPLDMDLAAAQAIQMFATPEELCRSIAYAVANDIKNLKNFAAEHDLKADNGHHADDVPLPKSTTPHFV